MELNLRNIDNELTYLTYFISVTLRVTILIFHKILKLYFPNYLNVCVKLQFIVVQNFYQIKFYFSIINSIKNHSYETVIAIVVKG